MTHTSHNMAPSTFETIRMLRQNNDLYIYIMLSKILKVDEVIKIFKEESNARIQENVQNWMGR